MDIHNYELQYKSSMARVEKADISKRNKELILSFVDDLIVKNISKPRLVRYMDVLTAIAKDMQKDFDKAIINDVKRIVGNIQQRSDYSAWTKSTYKIIIRLFYKWIKGTKKYPTIVSWIKIGISRSEKKLPSDGDLLTEKEVQTLISYAEHPRDKAFVSVLWESGARIGEIGNLSIRNVTFDKYGIVISVKGKTGSRMIRLISSTPYISTWLNNHPLRDNNNSPLWINIGTTKHNKMMSYGNMSVLLRRLFQKAGIKKRFNPHLFRHSRATFMANYLTEFQMNQYFGWIQGSDMPSTYVHMSGREVDTAILAMNGINDGVKKEEAKLQPIICPRCDTINANDSKHCNKCGGILDLKYAMELEQKREEEAKSRVSSDQLMNVLLKDKDVQALLMEKLKGLGAVGL